MRSDTSLSTVARGLIYRTISHLIRRSRITTARGPKTAPGGGSMTRSARRSGGTPGATRTRRWGRSTARRRRRRRPAGGARGYAGGKRTTGRKKHIRVETLGVRVVVVVTAARVSDAAGAVGLLTRISRFDHPRLPAITADRADHREMLSESIVRQWYEIQISSRPDGATGFGPLRHRWVVGRTVGWLMQHRRHGKEYERTEASSESQVDVSSVRLMVRRLTNRSMTPRFRRCLKRSKS